MPSLFAHATNLVFRCMPQDKPGQPHDYAAERKRNDRKPPRPPKGVTVRLGELDGLSAEFIQKSSNQKGTIFYIHGGGFTVGSARERRAICQYITANYGYNCVTFNYRLAPENLWPAPLEDCLTAYTALLKTGVSPKEIVFMGESAGGTLVLSLALLLKEKGLPQPKALVALSPCVTQADQFPSYTQNAATDYMPAMPFSPPASGWIGINWSRSISHHGWSSARSTALAQILTRRSSHIPSATR